MPKGRRATLTLMAAALACAAAFSYPLSAAPVYIAQTANGLGALAPAQPLPVPTGSSVMMTAELPPCGPQAPDVKPADSAPDDSPNDSHIVVPGTEPTITGDAVDGAGAASAASRSDASASDAGGEHPSAGQPAAATAAPDAAAPATECSPVVVAPSAVPDDAENYAFDYQSGDPAAPGLKWRPLSTPRPWFSALSPQEGMVLGDRNVSYRSLEGPEVSLGNLTPSVPAWGSAAPIGGVQISNLSTGANAVVPEGKLGYSSIWGRINNTDPTATQGDGDYGPTAGTSSLRYGLTPDLTLESQMQSARSLTATGLGTTYSAGQFGTVQAGATQSRFDAAGGWRYRLGYNVDVSDFLNLGYANQQTGAGYGDLSTYETGAITERQSTNTFSAGVPTGSWGTLSGTYSGVRTADGTLTQRYYGLSQSVTLAPGVSLGLGANRDFISRDYNVTMQLSLPVGR